MKKLWIFIVVFSFITVMLSTFFKSQYLTYSHKLFYGISTNLKETASVFDGFFKGQRLKEENENLKKQLSQNTQFEAENKLLKKENEELNELLRLNRENYGKNIVNAKISDINTTSNFTLTIDKGTRSGVSLGDVCVWGNALVGSVTEAFDDFSIITPITAPNVTVGIMNTNNDAGVILGNLALFKKNMCEISFFSDAVETTPDETIVTSGFSDIYPKGLTVGKIKHSGDSVRLLTEVDFFKIRTVSLISAR